MIEIIKRHQQVARYSSDLTTDVFSPSSRARTLNGIIEQYKVALANSSPCTFGMGDLQDAMRMMASMSEYHPIVRAVPEVHQRVGKVVCVAKQPRRNQHHSLESEVSRPCGRAG